MSGVKIDMIRTIDIEKTIKEIEEKSFKEPIFNGGYIWTDDAIKIIRNNITEIRGDEEILKIGNLIRNIK